MKKMDGRRSPYSWPAAECSARQTMTTQSTGRMNLGMATPRPSMLSSGILIGDRYMAGITRLITDDHMSNVSVVVCEGLACAAEY